LCLTFICGSDVMPEAVPDQAPEQTAGISGGFRGSVDGRTDKRQTFVFAFSKEAPLLGLPKENHHAAGIP
jgi:hypothetical protein